jgi:putative SOS response-associated peptidase YedK
MCGRYYRRSDKQKIAEAFHIAQVDDFLMSPWDYNVAPTNHQPIIRNNRDTGERELVMMRWGLVPHFAKSLADFKGFSTINARAESLLNTAMWRLPFQRRRCLVPADGFYEWKKLDAKTKQPYAYCLKDEEPFAFAGLWEAWKDQGDGSWLQSYSIITTTPNELTAHVHNRMPVILEPKDYNRWLERVNNERPPVDLLRPFPADGMKAQEANKDVANVKNNSANLLNSA